MKNLDYLLPAMQYLAEHAEETASARAVEFTLLVSYLRTGTEQPVRVAQVDLAAMSGTSIPTVSRVAAALQKTGRWEITSGLGRMESTYTPLFLDQLAVTSEEAK